MIIVKPKYRMTFKCTCGNVFKFITTNPDLMTASCPSCRSKERKTKFIRMGDGPVTDQDLLAEKIAQKLRETPEWQESYRKAVLSPIPQSSRIQTKAVDETAKIVMEDHKLGDLKDTVHQGEAAAPKLAPKLQTQADSFFTARRSRNTAGINTQAIARQALGGAYSPARTGAINPVAEQHKSKIRVPANIIASSNGKI